MSRSGSMNVSEQNNGAGAPKTKAKHNKTKVAAPDPAPDDSEIVDHIMESYESREGPIYSEKREGLEKLKLQRIQEGLAEEDSSLQSKTMALQAKIRPDLMNWRSAAPKRKNPQDVAILDTNSRLVKPTYMSAARVGSAEAERNLQQKLIEKKMRAN